MPDKSERRVAIVIGAGCGIRRVAALVIALAGLTISAAVAGGIA